MKKLTILILAAAMFAGCVQEQKKETGKTEAEAPAKKQKDVDAQSGRLTEKTKRTEKTL